MLWHIGGTPQTANNHCVYVFPCANNGVVSWACGAGHLLVCQCCLRGASPASGAGNRTLPLLSAPWGDGGLQSPSACGGGVCPRCALCGGGVISAVTFGVCQWLAGRVPRGGAKHPPPGAPLLRTGMGGGVLLPLCPPSSRPSVSSSRKNMFRLVAVSVL